MGKLSLLLAACLLFAFASVNGFFHSPRALPSNKDSGRSIDIIRSRTPQMSQDTSGENPVSMRQSFLSNSRDLLISLSVVAISTTSSSIRRADAATSDAVVAEAATTTPSTSAASSNIVPIITSKVYLDIKIANYTEESTGTNKGADGSGRVVFGLYGKDAPESVARVSFISSFLK